MGPRRHRSRQSLFSYPLGRNACLSLASRNFPGTLFPAGDFGETHCTSTQGRNVTQNLRLKAWLTLEPVLSKACQVGMDVLITCAPTGSEGGGTLCACTMWAQGGGGCTILHVGSMAVAGTARANTVSTWHICLN